MMKKHIAKLVEVQGILLDGSLWTLHGHMWDRDACASNNTWKQKGLSYFHSTLPWQRKRPGLSVRTKLNLLMVHLCMSRSRLAVV